MTTEIGTVYFTPYEEHLVVDILCGRGRPISLEHLIASLYAAPRDEPEWPEPTVLVLLGKARKKLARLGRRLENVVGRGYRIVRGSNK